MLIEDYIKLPKAQRQSHLRLDLPCVERGGRSTQFRGIMVEYFDVTFPTGHGIHLCHACNNARCSYPLHMYWGTYLENIDDAVKAGTHGKNSGHIPWNKGKKLSKKYRAKLSAAKKGKPNNNPFGVNQYTRPRDGNRHTSLS